MGSLGSNHWIFRVLPTLLTSTLPPPRRIGKGPVDRVRKAILFTQGMSIFCPTWENQTKRVKPHCIKQRQKKTLIGKAHWIVEQWSEKFYEEIGTHTLGRPPTMWCRFYRAVDDTGKVWKKNTYSHPTITGSRRTEVVLCWEYGQATSNTWAQAYRSVIRPIKEILWWVIHLPGCPTGIGASHEALGQLYRFKSWIFLGYLVDLT